MTDNVVKRVSTIFTVKDDGFNQSLSDINKQMKLTQSEIKLAGEKFKAFGGNTDDLKLKQEALTQQITNVRDKISLYNKSLEETPKKLEENRKKSEELKAAKEELNKKYKEAVNIYGEESEEAKKLAAELDNTKKAYTESEAKIKTNINTLNNHQLDLKNSETELAKLQGELKKTTTEIEKNSNKLLQAGDSLQKYGSKISSAGDKITSAGKVLTLGVTAPVVALGAAATKSSIEFESAFAGVKKTVNGTEEQFEELNQGIRGMSKQLPTAASDIAHVAEAAGQLGIKTENILGFTKTIIDLGNATNLAGEEGASSLAKFANITQMSQKDFDRLGSTIVALGNNSATTEADIVAMAMRLAGAGSQVGMTEAKILGLSAALSSVGIEAEAGGSSVSKLLVEMQLASETGGKSLSNFAKVAGMSSKQFQQAFKKDASSALIAFVKGLADSEKKGISAIKVLDDMGITEVRMRDSLLRAAGAGDLFNKSIDLGTKAWSENVALTNEANQRYATTESQLKMTKNQITDAAIQIGNNLLPAVRDAAQSIAKITESFSKLSPKTQENIIKFAALAAVTGPVVTGVGGLTKGIGGTIEVIGKFASKAAAAKVASTTIGSAASAAAGAGGVAGLSSSLGTVALAAAPYAAAGVVIAGAGYAIYKGLSKETIPAVDLFTDKIESTAKVVTDASGEMSTATETSVTKISDSTKTAVNSYLQLDKESTGALLSMRINGEKISQDTATSLSSIYSNMGNQITSKMKQDHDNQYKDMQDFFNNTSALTSQEEGESLKSLDEHYAFQTQIVDQGVAKINSILAKASQDKRQLTYEESSIINNIQDNMKTQAIKTLSENEVEAQIILQRMKDYDGRITAEQASEHIKKLNESKNNAVNTANQEYEKRLALITRMRDEAKVISADQADKMIEEAKRQRDGIVEKAEDTRYSALEKMRELNSNLDNEVDTGTGKILSTLDKLKRWWSGWKPETKTFSWSLSDLTAKKSQSGSGIPQNALGTNYFTGGITSYNEKGYELIDLPTGSKIRNHASSEMVVKRTAEEVASKMLSGLSKLLDTDKEVFLIMDKEAVGKAVVPIVSRKLATNTVRRK